MKRFLPCFVVLAAGLLAFAASDDVIPPVPAEPKVPAKVDLPAKDFAESVEEQIKIPDDKDPDKFTLQKTKTTFEMVYVKGGEFAMGSPANEAGRGENEGPVHKVTVRPYWLAKFETTWELFDLWFRNTNLPRRDEADGVFEVNNPEGKLAPDAITRPTNPYVDETYEHGRVGKPAICMSHHAAMVFCHWLRLKTGRGYRLPTEAEWEFACRAGQTGPFGFEGGKDKFGEYAWYKDNSKTEDKPEGTTHKVGSKKPNAFGLFDMHGNVAEWCLDQYDPKAYENFAKNPLKALSFVPPTDKKWQHVARGGSWIDPPERCRSAMRWQSDGVKYVEPDWMKEDPQLPRSIWWLTKMDMVGFRVALPVEEYPELVGLKPRVVKKGY